jgi:putative ABC transport system permease protein
VLRVLGASRPRIFGLVLTESAMLGLLGAVSGVVLAVVGGWIVAAMARQRLGLILEPWPAIRPAIAVGLAAILLAALAGLVPAVMAYRTSVARNLKPIG